MNAVTETAAATPAPVETKMVKFKAQLEARQGEFAAGLPAHIPVERFMRVILIAVSKNPDLLLADRASLFMAALNAATDGLLCDGRDAALVIFNSKRKDDSGRDVWFKAVQYMPMLAGILKKCRNSGQLASIVARVVYSGDKFRNWVDDDGEHLEYEAGDDQDRNMVRCAFAMAKLKDGSIEVEVLKPADIEKIRSVSRSKDKGPWVEWWEEMAKKSAIRRLSKRLPLSTDLDDLIRRDDSLYDLERSSDAAIAGPHGKRLTLASKLDALAGVPPHDPETGEITEPPSSGDGEIPPAKSEVEAGEANSTAASPAEKPADGHPRAEAPTQPAKAEAQPPPAPSTPEEYRAHVLAYVAEATSASALEAKWRAKDIAPGDKMGDRSLRQKLNIDQETFNELEGIVKARCVELKGAPT